MSLRLAATYASLTFFSFVGVLIRVGLGNAWNGYNLSSLRFTQPFYLDYSNPLYYDIFANIVGCVLMGFAVRWNDRELRNRYPISFFGITTGLCGSTTTFSGWQTQAALFILRKQVGVWFLILLMGLAINYVSLNVGFHLSELFMFLKYKFTFLKEGLINLNDLEVDENVKKVKTYEDSKTFQCVLIIVALLCFGMFWLLTFVEVDRRGYWIPAICGPFGTYIRYATRGYNKSLSKQFAISTFSINMFGCFFNGCLYVIKLHYDLFGSNLPSSSLVVLGFSTGFCGCLTTVSSFVNEMYGFKLTRAYFYAAISILGAQFLLIFSIGPYVWSSQ